MLVVQGQAFNLSRIGTAVCVPLTSNTRLGGAPGNVLLLADSTGLPKDSVANVSLLVAIDRTLLSERAGQVTPRQLDLVLDGIDLVLGRG